ncbi:MAG: phosphotransferase [Gammaproteobacteria bacterium]|jgi:hypothetical protein|nr:phosphotransferase [Gammaproteobacteria bacterium]
MASRQIFLPETPEAVSREWLSDVLGGEIIAVSQTPLGDGQGFMGDILLLDIVSEDPAIPSRVVAKLPKKANRVMGELLGVYEREIMFFRAFGEHLPVRIPRIYYSEFDRDKGSEKQAEILRALDKLPGFMNKVISALGTIIAAAKKRRYVLLIEFFGDMQPGDQLAGLDVARCQQVLRGIAPMHRQYWGSTELDDHFWLLEMDIDARIRHGMFLQHAQRYAQAMGPEVVPHLNWMREHGEALMRAFVADTPATLLHCDLRVDNVVFNGEACAFIDFQLVRKGPAVYDVAYFISSALPAEASDEEEEQVLRTYHSALGVADYDYAVFKRDYQRALLLILAGLSGATDVDLANDRGAEMMQAWMNRLKARVRSIDLTSILSASNSS